MRTYKTDWDVTAVPTFTSHTYRYFSDYVKDMDSDSPTLEFWKIVSRNPYQRSKIVKYFGPMYKKAHEKKGENLVSLTTTFRTADRNLPDVPVGLFVKTNLSTLFRVYLFYGSRRSELAAVLYDANRT
jgi:hypothetical protein